MIEPRKIFGGLGNRMFQGAYLLAQQAKGEIPDIYLQDEKYFENVKEQVKKLYGTDLIKTDYVSLHIRRGDYVNNSFYVDLTETDYYDKAIAEFPNREFLIFCADRQDNRQDMEDRAWCMKWAEKKGIEFMMRYHDDEIADMNMMASCDGHIGANSSFSWWAAYIGGGKTVMPKHWFSDGVERIKLLEEWIKI